MDMIDKSVCRSASSFHLRSRPNVTIDAAGLCIMSGNAIIFAAARERFTRIRSCAVQMRLGQKLPEDAVQLVKTTARVVGQLLQLNQTSTWRSRAAARV